jgi:hypothetical protein
MSATRATHPAEHFGGRKRTGSLLWRRGKWYARLTVDRDGEPVRLIRALGTDSKQRSRKRSSAG